MAPSRRDRREVRHRLAELGRKLDDWASGSEVQGSPAGEWDCLIGPVVTLLSAGAPADEIARRVTQELTDHYGLSDPLDDLVFATELRTWWDGLEAR